MTVMFSSPCCNNNENSELMNLKIEKAIRDEMKNNPEAFKGDKGDKGQDFTIKKTFPSVEAMNADTSLNEGDFVLIASNENDEDNAKMYVKTKDGYQFLTDLSGAKGIKGEKGDPGQDGANGRDGVDGRSITQTGSSQDADGNTVVSLSDGSSFTVSKGAKGDKGEDGRNGVDGRDATPLTVVSSTINNDGNTIATLSDGSQIIIKKGTDGQNGRDLIVTRTETDSDGNTVLTLSDGTTAKIQKGDKGADGRDGIDGHDKVQVSETQPTDPNIVLWVKPNAVPCSECNPCEKLKVMETLSNYDTTKEGNLSKSVYQSLSLNDTRYKDISVVGMEEKTKDELKQIITNDGANYNEVIDNFTVGDGDIGLIRKGQPVTVTYNNINDSFVNGTKISKVVFKYTLLKNALAQGSFNNKDNKKDVDYAPIQTLKFVTGTLRYVGFDTDIKTEVTFLDESGNPINVKGALVNFSSLNSIKNDGTEYEGVANLNGRFIKFNGSSIDDHNGLAYSPTSNDKVSDGSKFNSSEWDNTSDKSYYGSIVGQITSDTDKIMFDIIGKNTGYTRFIFKDYKDNNVPVFPSGVKANSNDCGVLRYKDQNGNWVPFPMLRGEKGQDGVNGQNGRDGRDGTNGRDGVDGRSITITENHQDANGNTIITFSDGTVTQVNRGEKGDKGDDGQNGVNGRDGIDGVNGTNGVDGRDGRDGRDGKDLTIKKTFPSVEAMNADTSLAEGDLVIISSNVDDEDNAKLYVKTANGYNYLTDLSGAKGIQGEAGRDGRDGTDGNSITMTNKEILDNGNTKVTLSDGNSFIVQKGQDGRDGRDGTNGVNGQDGHSPAITIDPATGHWKVDGVDTGVNGKAPELPYKVIVGPGRPDQPNTTGGKITGSEVTGDEYVSTNGAGVGANVWKKVNGKWEVIQGDTGWRKITTDAIDRGYVMVRRTAENCYVSAGGGTWGTFKIAPTANVESVQMGVSGQKRNRIILTRMPQGWETPFTVSGQKVTHDGYDEVGNAVISKSDDQNAIQIRNYTGDKNQNQVLRFPMLSYPTSKAWPNTLPGEATDL